ncbi:hypothetical protein CONLIGDRAFT_188997 [Coniochaeta ligniaria NRRL 30616]|uniref:cyclin-dependent kinase n=1 Tax=Coniochaeta ligniaria NRRL 30616 TaxID=1408157 RepID=A0A1J7J0Y4_9PEZI|nr:hypothetical protein CONLIGDRAFT_188997 [Coniochaeta ligniaria NRRL 30616]
MASKAKSSRWAVTDEDVALEAKLKKEKGEKKRLKAEKARKQQEEAERAKAAATQQTNGSGDGDGGPPAKRRRLSPQPGGSAPTTNTTDTTGQPKLLRFDGGGFGKCRSVENYDKLNDIEEGAYGWVARAKELATGKIVALKRLKIDPKDRSGLPVTGLREIQILRDCDHRNVVRLKEVVVGEDTRKIEK